MSGRKLFIIIFCFYPMAIFASSSLEVLQAVRSKLPLLRDSPTGAIDAEGKYTKDARKGLNCSGFSKWIIDGFYFPLAKNEPEKYISLRMLREKHLQERGSPDILIYEKSRDPYFGLDWTRNLAVELGKKRKENPSYKTYDIVNSTVEIYMENRGYPLTQIEKVLKEQAILYPEKIYLGSINGMYGSTPSLWQHYHVAIFIPYYKENELKIAVLERNKETSFSYLIKRYPNTYCHLVGILLEGEFELMEP